MSGFSATLFPGFIPISFRFVYDNLYLCLLSRLFSHSITSLYIIEGTASTLCLDSNVLNSLLQFRAKLLFCVAPLFRTSIYIIRCKGVERKVKLPL